MVAATAFFVRGTTVASSKASEVAITAFCVRGTTAVASSKTSDTYIRTAVCVALRTESLPGHVLGPIEASFVTGARCGAPVQSHSTRPRAAWPAR